MTRLTAESLYDRRVRFLLVLALVVVPGPASAGGWLQLEAGPSVVSFHASPTDRWATGLGLGADVIRGGRVARRLVLFGQLGGAVISTPLVYLTPDVDDHWPDSALLWTIQLGGGALHVSDDGRYYGAALVGQMGAGHADSFDLRPGPELGLSLRGGREWRRRPGRWGRGITVRLDVLVAPDLYDPGSPRAMTLLLGVFYAATR